MQPRRLCAIRWAACNNGWALAGLAEVYKRKGDAKAEASARKAYGRAWLGGAAPDIARLQAARRALVRPPSDGLGAGLQRQM